MRAWLFLMLGLARPSLFVNLSRLRFWRRGCVEDKRDDRWPVIFYRGNPATGREIWKCRWWFRAAFVRRWRRDRRLLWDLLLPADERGRGSRSLLHLVAADDFLADDILRRYRCRHLRAANPWPGSFA